jgi:hypothetical protein
MRVYICDTRRGTLSSPLNAYRNVGVGIIDIHGATDRTDAPDAGYIVGVGNSA